MLISLCYHVEIFDDLIALIALVLDKSPDLCACTAGLELLHHEPR